MSKKKKTRTRGKLQLSRYFQELKEGDAVAVINEPSVKSNVPKRMQGRTGFVAERRGKAYVVKIKDQNKEKDFLINPIHLKKIKLSKSQEKK